jgi:hypothetical protein
LQTGRQCTADNTLEGRACRQAVQSRQACRQGRAGRHAVIEELAGRASKQAGRNSEQGRRQAGR